MVSDKLFSLSRKLPYRYPQYGSTEVSCKERRYQGLRYVMKTIYHSAHSRVYSKAKRIEHVGFNVTLVFSTKHLNNLLLQNVLISFGFNCRENIGYNYDLWQTCERSQFVQPSN